MTTDKKKLRELAGAATPGPWKKEEGHPIVNSLHPDKGYMIHAYEADIHYGLAMGETYNADAAFIAAANPSAVIELLDEVERLREALKYYLQAGHKEDRRVASIKAKAALFYEVKSNPDDAEVG